MIIGLGSLLSVLVISNYIPPVVTFTSRLGSPRSYLGNIALGSVS